MKPKITLVTCHHFRPDLLRRAIQSVQKQTFKDYEHIIVSDHCPFTEHVYKDFIDDDRIKFFEVEEPHEENYGALAFRLAIKKAESDYICYLLDDDVLYENHLEVHYNYMSKTNGVGQSYHDFARFSPPNDTAHSIATKSFQDLVEMSKSNKDISERSIDVSCLSHTKDAGVSVGWKTQTELGIGGTPEDNWFMAEIGVDRDNRIDETTCIKCGWGGYWRDQASTRGLDSDYKNILLSKLVKDESTISGYRLNADSPYAYPDLINTLYGE